MGGNAAAAWLDDGRPARMTPTAEAWTLVPAGGGASSGRWVRLTVTVRVRVTVTVTVRVTLTLTLTLALTRWVRLVPDLLPGASGWRAEPGPSARRGAAVASLGGGLVAVH